MLLLMLFALPPNYPYHTVRTAPFHPRIHSFGNVGWLGKLHAEQANTFTSLIDIVAYKGTNLRETIAERLRDETNASQVVELGCGVGTLTRSLVARGFEVTAVDTSAEMIEVASRENNATFLVQNAVDTETRNADIVVACMLFHELPKQAQVEILEAIDAPEIWIIDIATNYTPSPAMLMGEPYLIEYLYEFNSTVTDFAAAAGRTLATEEIVPGHVTLWRFS